MPDNLIPHYQSFSELAKDARTALYRAGITDVEPGSAGRAFTEAISRKIADLYYDTEQAFRNSRSITASGIYLDLIGLDLGISRRGVSSVETINNQKFFVPRGVLGDYTSGQDLIMGPGVQVNRPAGQTPSYKVIPYTYGGDYPVWKASKSEIIVKTLSVQKGQDANASAGVLTAHNLPRTEILCTNLFDILSGQLPESDEDYRYRLSGFGLYVQGSNQRAIEQAALLEPDVDSILIRPFTQGPGSLTVVIIPIKGVGGEGLAERVLARVQSVVSVGERVFTQLAHPVYLGLSLRVKSTSSSAEADIQNATLDFLGTLNAGDQLVISQLLAYLQNLDSVISIQVLSMNIDGESAGPLDYQLADDEFFVVNSPISRTIKVDVI